MLSEYFREKNCYSDSLQNFNQFEFLDSEPLRDGAVQKVDYVICNFLHTGANQTNEPEVALRENQQLFQGLFRSILRCSGSSGWFCRDKTKIHISIKDTLVYRAWNIAQKAKEFGFIETPNSGFEFATDLYEAFGYKHTRTREAKGEWSERNNEKFRLDSGGWKPKTLEFVYNGDHDSGLVT